MSTLSRFLGTLLGVAVGDAVGRPFEGSIPRSREEVIQSLRNAEELIYTDDTQMTVDLATSLIESGGFDPEDLVKRFLIGYDPTRGYGFTTTTVLQRVKEGVSWEMASHDLMGGEGSYGNGAAMRISPVPLVYHQDPDRMREVVESSSRITHAHPLGVEGALLQAESLRTLLQTSPPEFHPADLLSELRKVVRSEQFLQQLEKIENLLESHPSLELVRDELGCGSEAHRSVPTAIWCFIQSPRDFSSCVLSAVTIGGDTDTIASMAGALNGALNGVEAIPGEWLAKLENREAIEDTARKLFLLHVRLVLGNRCEMCLSEGPLQAYKLDPTGPDEVSNYILLCDRCKRESEQEEKEFMARPRKHGKYRAVYRKVHRRG